MSDQSLLNAHTWAICRAAGVGSSAAEAAADMEGWEAAGDDGAPLTAVCRRDALGERGVPNEPLGLRTAAAPPGLRPCTRKYA